MEWEKFAMGKVVVLIEDNLLDEKLTVRALKSAGTEMDVIVLRDGAQALNFFKGEGECSGGKMSVLPTLVLLDLKLPKVSGLEVLKELRFNLRTRSLQVVVLTSSIEKEDLIQSYKLGANSYIRKQVDFVRFSESVKKITEYWLGLNECLPDDMSEKVGTG